MGAHPRVVRYRVEDCKPLCRVNPRNAPPGFSDAAHRKIEEGLTLLQLEEWSISQGYKVARQTFDIHRRKHLVKLTDLVPVIEIEDVPPDQKLSDLDILERIIQAGARGLKSPTVRISPDMTLKAMELRLKMTNGGVFDDLMAVVAKAMATEAPAAVASEDEQAQAGTDDDPGG